MQQGPRLSPGAAAGRGEAGSGHAARQPTNSPTRAGGIADPADLFAVLGRGGSGASPSSPMLLPRALLQQPAAKPNPKKQPLPTHSLSCANSVSLAGGGQLDLPAFFAAAAVPPSQEALLDSSQAWRPVPRGGDEQQSVARAAEAPTLDPQQQAPAQWRRTVLQHPAELFDGLGPLARVQPHPPPPPPPQPQPQAVQQAVRAAPPASPSTLAASEVDRLLPGLVSSLAGSPMSTGQLLPAAPTAPRGSLLGRTQPPQPQQQGIPAAAGPFAAGSGGSGKPARRRPAATPSEDEAANAVAEAALVAAEAAAPAGEPVQAAEGQAGAGQAEPQLVSVAEEAGAELEAALLQHQPATAPQEQEEAEEQWVDAAAVVMGGSQGEEAFVDADEQLVAAEPEAGGAAAGVSDSPLLPGAVLLLTQAPLSQPGGMGFATQLGLASQLPLGGDLLPSPEQVLRATAARAAAAQDAAAQPLQRPPEQQEQQAMAPQRVERTPAPSEQSLQGSAGNAGDDADSSRPRGGQSWLLSPLGALAQVFRARGAGQREPGPGGALLTQLPSPPLSGLQPGDQPKPGSQRRPRSGQGRHKAAPAPLSGARKRKATTPKAIPRPPSASETPPDQPPALRSERTSLPAAPAGQAEQPSASAWNAEQPAAAAALAAAGARASAADEPAHAAEPPAAPPAVEPVAAAEPAAQVPPALPVLPPAEQQERQQALPAGEQPSPRPALLQAAQRPSSGGFLDILQRIATPLSTPAPSMPASPAAGPMAASTAQIGAAPAAEQAAAAPAAKQAAAALAAEAAVLQAADAPIAAPAAGAVPEVAPEPEMVEAAAVPAPAAEPSAAEVPPECAAKAQLSMDVQQQQEEEEEEEEEEEVVAEEAGGVAREGSDEDMEDAPGKGAAAEEAQGGAPAAAQLPSDSIRGDGSGGGAPIPPTQLVLLPDSSEEQLADGEEEVQAAVPGAPEPSPMEVVLTEPATVLPATQLLGAAEAAGAPEVSSPVMAPAAAAGEDAPDEQLLEAAAVAAAEQRAAAEEGAAEEGLAEMEPAQEEADVQVALGAEDAQPAAEGIAPADPGAQAAAAAAAAAAAQGSLPEDALPSLPLPPSQWPTSLLRERVSPTPADGGELWPQAAEAAAGSLEAGPVAAGTESTVAAVAALPAGEEAESAQAVAVKQEGLVMSEGELEAAQQHAARQAARLDALLREDYVRRVATAGSAAAPAGGEQAADAEQPGAAAAVEAALATDEEPEAEVAGSEQAEAAAAAATRAATELDEEEAAAAAELAAQEAALMAAMAAADPADVLEVLGAGAPAFAAAAAAAASAGQVQAAAEAAEAGVRASQGFSFPSLGVAAAGGGSSGGAPRRPSSAPPRAVSDFLQATAEPDVADLLQRRQRQRPAAAPADGLQRRALGLSRASECEGAEEDGGEGEEAGLQLPPLPEAAPAAVLAAAGTQTSPAVRGVASVQAGPAALPLPRGLLVECGAQTAAAPQQRGAALQAGRPQLRLVAVNAAQTEPAAGTSMAAAQTSPGLGTAAASVQVRMERVRPPVAATGAQAGTPQLAAGRAPPAASVGAQAGAPQLAGGAAAASNGGTARQPAQRAPRLVPTGEVGEDGLVRMRLPDDHQPTRVVPDRAAMEAAQQRQAEARRVREQRQQQAEEQRTQQRERQRQQREAEEEAQAGQLQRPAAAAAAADAAALSGLAGRKRARVASGELATPRVAQLQQAGAPALQLSPLMLAAQQKIRQRQLELQRQRQQLQLQQHQQQEWQVQQEQPQQEWWPQQGRPVVPPPAAAQEPAAPPSDGWQQAKRPRLVPLPRLSRSPLALAAAHAGEEEDEEEHQAQHQAGGWRASCPPPPAPRAAPQPHGPRATPAGAALAAAAPASAGGYASPLGAAPRGARRLTPLMSAQPPVPPAAAPRAGHAPAAALQQPSPRRRPSPCFLSYYRPTEEELAAAEAEAERKAAAVIERLRARAAQR